MSPPTEQLVRDYLNRLSVAARSRLSLRERQVLLDRTRTRIEAECGGVADASPALVRQVLANLGDPIGLVDAEYAADPQLAAVAPAAAEASGPVSFVAKHNGLANGTAVRAAIAGLPATTVLASAGPTGPAGAPAPSGDAGPGASAMPPGGGDPAPPSAGGDPAEAARPVPGAGVKGGDAAAIPGQDRPAGIPAVPAPRPASEGEAAASAPGPADPAPLAAEPGAEPAGDELVKEPSRAAEAADAAFSFVSGHVRELAAVALRHKVETAAVLLIGVGGALFPPVWLLGALIAVPSKVWDLRDKWLSLGLPILVVLVGAVLVVVAGGQRGSLGSYGYEAWIAAGRLSRVVAVAGALYLLWRLRRGRRSPRLPPWKTAKKFDL